MPKEVVILEHVSTEKAGTLLDHLNKNGIPFQSIRLYERGYALPPLDSAAALIVMGGPMNVYEEDKFPFLREENLYIKEAVKNKVPYLGICLGSQLLAKALGARVYKAKRAEVGWDDVRLSESAQKDGIFSGLDLSSLKVLQWHEDTFDLPEGAVHLASSPAVPHQAYSLDGLFYGLQFHVEVDRPMLQQWFEKRDDLEKILSEYDGYHLELARITERIYGNFFSCIDTITTPR